MNKFILSALIIFSALSTGRVDAQESKKNNYVVSTVQVKQIIPILLTAAALAEEDGEDFGILEVIIYGATVKELTDISKMKNIMRQANQNIVIFKVCQIALDHYSVSLEDIPEEFQPVENAFTELLQLQRSGYFSIEL